MKFPINTVVSLTITLALTFIVLAGNAQVKLSGAYVLSKIDYLNGEELPDDNLLKYTYVKYTFNQNEISISGTYYENGRPFFFIINGDYLTVRSSTGAVLNTMKVLESTDNRLVLVSGSANGSVEDPWAIKYILYKEEYIQNNIPLRPDGIFSINEKDTVFKSSQKVYAKFNGESFQSYIYDLIRGRTKEVKSGELLSCFIIDKDGQPDSLKIIQGINRKFDEEYVRLFNAARYMWQPAKLNGQPVRVLMTLTLKYSSSAQTIPSYFNGQKANIAYKNQDYKTALIYYDLALEVKGDEIEHLYRRGICKQKLGNLAGACADWSRIKQLGKDEADELLSKYCK